VVFPALGPGANFNNPPDRRIYAYTSGGPTPVTTPLIDTCNSPCSEPSTPVGLIGDQFYFQLFVIPAGSMTAQQAFDTVDIDGDGDENAAGTKYPSMLTRVGSRMYFRARTDSVPDNPDPEYGLFSHAPGEGLATVKINSDFLMSLPPPGNGARMIAIGDTLYFIANVGSNANAKYKLFKHTVGDGPLVAADAIAISCPAGATRSRF
jgi:hypothetical protein